MRIVISVIVVNFNGGDYLGRCLESLIAQSFPDFEVILIDNGSTDGSIDNLPVLPENFRIIRAEANIGFARANNIGASLASGSWLALLNPDATAAREWLESLLRAVTTRPNYRIVASAQFKMDNTERLDGVGDCYSIAGYPWRGGYGHSKDAMPQAGEVFAACGASAFYPKDAFLAVGGFDESFFCYVEDVDLGFRLRLVGEKCQFDPECRVEHAGSGITGQQSDFVTFHGVRNTVWAALKNIPWPLLFLVTPTWMLATSILYLTVSADRRLSIRRGLKAAVVGLAPIWSARKMVQNSRSISFVTVAKFISWNLRAHKSHLPDVRPFPACEQSGVLSDTSSRL
jgi:GT2 family glycosyltransferase